MIAAKILGLALLVLTSGASPEATRLTFFLKHSEEHRAALEKHFHQVSNPEHPRYGMHLSHRQVLELQRPTPQHALAVREHLATLGGIEVAASLAGDKIVALVPNHRLQGHQFPRTVLDAIDTVAGLPRVRPVAPRPARSLPRARRSPQSCLADRAVPPCIREAYGLGNLTGKSSKNGQAVVVNQGFKPSDLKLFCKEYGLTGCAGHITEVGENSGEAGDEASLDVQYISATGQGVPLWWVYIDGHTANPFSDWLTWASNSSVLPLVHSLSVGEPEDEFSTDNPGGVARMNAEMMALGARGVSILFASGDSGYQVAQKYGSSSPYVTSVGGVFNGELGDDVLQVDSLSTGGFSSLAQHPIQPWQREAVKSWLGTKGARPGRFNSTRRCAPDLSVYDSGFSIVQDGSDTPIGGTSAAAPTLAGMISLINDALLEQSKPPLGFLNYFLYQNQHAFLDIVHGDNQGYAATAGYDPASGLGTFGPGTFSALKSAALSHTPPAGSAPVLLVGLRHAGGAAEELERRFWSVAEGHETQINSVAEMASIVAAPEETVNAATAWLASIGADLSTLRLSPTGDSIQASWPAGQHHTRAPKVPSSSEFSDYVVLQRGTEGALRQPHTQRSLQSGSESGMGPEGQKAAYGVPAGLKGSNKNNSQMVFGTGTFGYREADIQMFFETYAKESSVKDVSFDKQNVWQGDTGKNFVEGELDVSYIAGMAPGVKTLVANTNLSAATESGEAYGAALLSFLVELNGRDELPLVLSMSLGSLSFGACDKVCNALAAQGEHSYRDCWQYMQTQFQVCMFESAVLEQRIDAELAKLGLRGVTVTAASGDGASHFAFGPFSGGIGDELDSIICAQMNMPVYPTCSPYVLSVGGTQWSSDEIYGPECSSDAPCAWTDGGAGFAWQHAQPSYQANVTSQYVAAAEHVAPKTMAPRTTYNIAGRGYPDVAALAQFGIPLCDYGGCSGSGGTSASAPTVAGMLSLINDARLNNKLPPLGFINTKLYALMQDPEVYKECFVDVGVDKVGSDWDCQTYSSCDGCNDGAGAGRGFVAIKGWDAQTGWGQPKFVGWLKHLGAN